MSQPKPTKPARKTYQTPEVVHYGTLRELTQGTATPTADVGKPGSQV